MGSNNDFVVFGTPLEPLEEDEIPKKRPAPDLTVRDERGRQRFHGAFTGGFSAGYFNTVGTKEGWAPASFTSSRKKKADGIQQRNPEDFMDEEDLGVFGIAPRSVQPTKDFLDEAKIAKKRPFPLFPSEGPIPGEAPLRNIIQPVSDSIGIKLLKKMGWKPGQGIGPRIKKHIASASSTPSGAKVFECTLQATDNDDEDDIYAEGHTFAPKDVATLPYTPKDNFFGIGYSGLAQDNVLSSIFEPPSAMTVVEKGKKLSIHGQAFGVGAFEDDDEDIYAKDDMSRYNFALEDPDFTEIERKKKVEAKIHHVQEVLEGFHLAKQAVTPKKHFPPPELPKHFRPIHRPSPGVHVAELEPPIEEHNRFLDRHSMTATDRSIALEGGFKGSVFDLMSESDRRRLTAIKLGQKLEDITPEKPVEPAKDEPNKLKPNYMKQKPIFLGSMAKKPEKNSVFGLLATEDKKHQVEDKQESDSSEMTLATHLSQVSKYFQSTSFKPFIKDKEKQERYEQFLLLAKAGDKEKLENLQPQTMTEWEKQKEMEEFYRAALLYRPLASSLETRFTSASHQENDDQFVELRVDEEQTIYQDDQQKAASLKLFGLLTRTTFEWHPDRILCRRFNVPNPYPDSSMVGLPTAKRDKVSIFNFLTTEDELKSDGRLPAKDSKPAAISSEEKMEVQKPEQLETETTIEDIQPEEKAEDISREEEEEEEAEKERPPMDLFRAIFQNTDSENDPSSDSEEEPTAEPGVPEKPEFQSHQESTKKQNVVAKGVFANLDLDALCRRPTGPIPVTSNSQKATELSTAPKVTKPEPSIFYGPALPPTTETVTSRAESNKNEERHTNKPKKQKHKKHKHKSKKSKHKSKHSHKYGTKDRPDSSDSSDSNISNMEILQKMVEIYRKNR